MLPTPRPSEADASQVARFGTTQWSVVLQAGRGADEALLRLCQLYWQPLLENIVQCPTVIICPSYLVGIHYKGTFSLRIF